VDTKKKSFLYCYR